MKILLINYRYFVSGGPERYMFNVKNALEEAGHSVIPFSINYSSNEACEYSKYFVSPLDENGGVYFHEHNASAKTYIKTLERLFYSREVELALIKLIEDTRPDVAYVLHYLRKLSPSVLNALKKMKIPIIVRLSDYQMLCPQAHCLRNDIPCEKCVGGSLYPSIKYKCVKNSRIASFLNLSSTKYHVVKRYFEYIDRFVVTNEFAMKMMIKGGYNKARLEVIPTFVDSNSGNQGSIKSGSYITYIGRLDPTKGVDLLIEAFQKVYIANNTDNLKLLIIGGGDKEYVKLLHDMAKKSSISNYIEFKGRMDKKDVNSCLASSLLNIIASRWYENLPNVLLESYAAGVPVVASNIGSLSETVIAGKTGDLFEPGNSSDLANKVNVLLSDRERLIRMSAYCKKIATEKYSKNIHISKLLNLFSSVIDAHRKNANQGKF